jgi:hypothetical protein
LCGCRTLRVRVISPSSWQPGLAVVFRRRGVSGVVGCRYACRFHPGWGVGPIHRLVCGHSAAGQGAGWSLGSFVVPQLGCSKLLRLVRAGRSRCPGDRSTAVNAGGAAPMSEIVPGPGLGARL